MKRKEPVILPEPEGSLLILIWDLPLLRLRSAKPQATTTSPRILHQSL